MEPETLEPGVDKSTAMTAVQEAMQICQRMGANDSELPALQQLQEGLLSGEINPNEAIRRAKEILESKQDYH